MIIPKTQKAAVKQGSGNTATVLVQDVPVQEPGPNQILVKINYTGLCASDITLLKSEGGFDMAPTTNGIVGHEGAGTVAAVGSDVQGLWQTGDRAGIKFIASVCRKCEYCTNGKDECHRPNMQASGYTIAGTFQEYVVTDARYATRLPEGVSDEEAGPIMCGGVTALVACKRSGVQPGEWVVISGAGGGMHIFSFYYFLLLVRSCWLTSTRSRPLRNPIRQTNGHARHCYRLWLI